MQRKSRQLSRRELLFAGGALTLSARMTHAETTPAKPARRFDPQRFVEDCRAADAGSGAQQAIRELLARELADRDAVLAGLGAPAKGGLQTIHRSDTLTILNIVWAPLMQL